MRQRKHEDDLFYCCAGTSQECGKQDSREGKLNVMVVVVVYKHKETQVKRKFTHKTMGNDIKCFSLFISLAKHKEQSASSRKAKGNERKDGNLASELKWCLG
jgi:hypothetical protein